MPTADSIPNSAVAWASDQMGGNFAGYATGKSLQRWTGMCARFVANAYGAPSAGGSATELWNNPLLKRTMQPVPSNAPKGLLVFWTYTDEKGNDLGGHVAIY